MTTGMLGDDQSLLTKQSAADLLQVAVDATSLVAEGHWAALLMGDRKPSGRIPKPEPLATGFLRGAVLITQESAEPDTTIHPRMAAGRPTPRARHGMASRAIPRYDGW